MTRYRTSDNVLSAMPRSDPFHPDHGVVIETKRLRLRCYRDDDLARLVDMAGRWEIAGWFTNLPYPYSEDIGRGWIAFVQRNHASGRPTRFAVAAKENDQLVGACGLDADSGVDREGLELGYWVGMPFWGQGFGREAVSALLDYGLRVLGLPSIKAVTHPDNIASQKLLLACGLKFEGPVELEIPMRRGGTTASLFRTRQVR